MSPLKHVDKRSPLLPYEQMYNYFTITINLFQNSTQMNKILFQLLQTDIISHTPPDILIDTSTSTRPNQFHSTLHTNHPHRYVCRYIYYNFIAFSAALLIINLAQSFNF